MARTKREIGQLVENDERDGQESGSGSGESASSGSGIGYVEVSIPEEHGGESGEGVREPAARKRGRPRRSAGGDDTGYIRAGDVGKRERKTKDAPHDLRHATALLANISATVASISGIAIVKLEIDECEQLVKAIDEFIRVWFPNAGKKIFDEKTSTAIALGFAVLTIASSRAGVLLSKSAPALEAVSEAPTEPSFIPDVYNVASL